MKTINRVPTAREIGRVSLEPFYEELKDSYFASQNAEALIGVMIGNIREPDETVTYIFSFEDIKKAYEQELQAKIKAIYSYKPEKKKEALEENFKNFLEELESSLKSDEPCNCISCQINRLQDFKRKNPIFGIYHEIFRRPS